MSKNFANSGLRVCLVFPPNWNCTAGSPHLGLPCISAALAGMTNTTSLDLNHGFLSWAFGYPPGIPNTRCLDLESLNEPYFAFQDLLQASIGSSGEWVASEGLRLVGSPECSSRKSLELAHSGSPFRKYIAEVGAPAILASDPDIIGIGVPSLLQLYVAIEVAVVLRQQGFTGHITLGGNTISRLYPELSSADIFDTVDSLVVFEGEEPIRGLVKAIEQSTPFELVSGLVTENKQEPFNSTTGRRKESLADMWSTPQFDGLPVGRYWGCNYIPILAARGCYYGKCSFCAIPFGWGPNGFAGQRSAKRVYQDMLSLSELYGIYRFKFVDEALPVPLMRELARLILDGNVEFEWEGYTRLEKAFGDPEFARLLGQAGFRKGYFGVEILGSRNALNKKDANDPLRIFENCSVHGIRGHCFCMFGYPGTTYADAVATVDFLIKHSAVIDTADIFPWTYAKHTNVPQVKRIVTSDQDWALEFDHEAIEPGVFSSSEIQRFVADLEDRLWSEVPRMLHPTYRMLSPWKAGLECIG